VIWDCFLYSGEADMLECRLTELDSLDCKFVIAEADTTFQGRPKPLGYLENKERFAPWADRIIYLVTVLPEADETYDPWVREYAQRDQLLEVALERAKHDDLIIFGDVDEIPDTRLLLTPGTVLGMRHHQFAADWLNPYPWRGSVITRPVTGLKPQHGRLLRDCRQRWPMVIPDAGWHLSWLGGIDAAKEKAHSFSHTEFTGKVCKWLDEGHCYEDGLVWDDNQELTVQQVRASITSCPKWIREGNCPESWFRWKR
jgi:beta-1,4-mannosyl-glycoprotein beta-1,4-N-acetylglucosaminyltransferase